MSFLSLKTFVFLMLTTEYFLKSNELDKIFILFVSICISLRIFSLNHVHCIDDTFLFAESSHRMGPPTNIFNDI